MESLNIKGLSIAIINDGNIVYHAVKGVTNVYTSEKVNSTTLFEAASTSKSVFAYFVMKQVEKGIFNLDTPLYTYLPNPDIEYDDRYKLVTTRMVLCHTSGFPNWRKDNKLTIEFTPGTKFLYSGEGYRYLAKVIAHLNGIELSNLDNLFQKEIALPLGLDNFSFALNKDVWSNLANAHDNVGVVFDNWKGLRREFSAAGGLYTESVSYAKFLIAIMEKRGLTTESFNEIFKEQVMLNDSEWFSRRLGAASWGLGFYVRPSEFGINYGHIGNNLGYTAGFLINEDAKFGYVFFTNSNQRNKFHNELYSFLSDKVD